MKIKKPKHYAWPTNKEQSAHMKARQAENLLMAKTNKAENWMKEQLKKLHISGQDKRDGE